MPTASEEELRLDRTAFSVVSLYDASDDKAYWLMQTTETRLEHMQRLRQINYGDKVGARLQRILEVAERMGG